MFEFGNLNLQPYVSNGLWCTQSESTTNRELGQLSVLAARKLYDRAQRRARLTSLWQRLRRRPCQLLALSATLAQRQVVARHDAGLRTVPLTEIRGSENRCHDFDHLFRPRSTHTRERWLSVAAAWLTGTKLPPVELIQVGSDYFVRDGHHRVSVAHVLRQANIDAQVTVWEVLPVHDRQMARAGSAAQPAYG